MTTTVIQIDLGKSPYDNDMIHNRWHPDIPMVARVKPGDDFIVQCYDWTGGQIRNDDDAADVRDVDLTQVHFLSGPIGVEGAEPGDLLIVDILEIDACDQEDSGPFSGQGWGYTGVFAKSNGGGFLVERFPDAYKVIWAFRGDIATSRHIPELSYTGIHHPGLMGTAPSHDLLAKWTKRETDLIKTDPMRVPPLALPPLPDSAILGALKGADFDRLFLSLMIKHHEGAIDMIRAVHASGAPLVAVATSHQGSTFHVVSLRDKPVRDIARDTGLPEADVRSLLRHVARVGEVTARETRGACH